MDMVSVSHRCAEAVIAAYEMLPASAKPMRGEYTVLAGIVAANSSTNECHVLSLGTGTKCIGRDACAKDACRHLLRDSHAEVIARRGLQHFLLSEMMLFNYSSSETNRFLCLSSDDDPFLFSLKPEWCLYLYVSENPCGDASIYLTSSDTYTFTGAKLIVNGDTTREPAEQVLGALRIKSSRSDVEEAKRTLSMSCSDKISKWICYGLTSSFLKPLMSPIHLHGIVVSRDTSSSAANQLVALTRAFCTRLGEVAHPVKVFVIDAMHSDTRQRTSNAAVPCPSNDDSSPAPEVFSKRRKIEIDTSSSLSCNWIAGVPSANSKKKCGDGVYEITVGHLGCLQGTTKKGIGSLRSRSRLSSSALMDLSMRCISELPSFNERIQQWSNCLQKTWSCTKKELLALDFERRKELVKNTLIKHHSSVFKNWLGNRCSKSHARII